MKKAFFFFITTILLGPAVEAQNAAVEEVINNLTGVGKSEVSYDYKIQLYDLKRMKLLDEIKGIMKRKNAFYLDSNSICINVRDNQFALQINLTKHIAYLKSIQQFKKASRGTMGNEPAVLFDIAKLIEKNLRSSTVVQDGEGGKIITLLFKDAELSEVSARIDHNTKLRRIVMKIRDGSDYQNTVRVLTMENFSDHGIEDGFINTDRFVEVTKAGYRLKGRFSSYPVKQIRL